jgi:thioredoxin-like negative regulator of GroEL
MKLGRRGFIETAANVSKNLVDKAVRWNNRMVSRTGVSMARLIKGAGKTLGLSKQNKAKSYGLKDELISGVPDFITVSIRIAKSTEELATLQKKLDAPLSDASKLTPEQKDIVNRLIKDRIAVLNDSNKIATMQSQQPLKSLSAFPRATKKIAEFINNATTTNQLRNLQKKLDDPKSQFSKLSKEQKKDVDLLITNKIVALNDNNKATTMQPQKPLKSLSAFPRATKKIAEFINNATTTNQLRNLQKKLDDPKSQFSKLSKEQKKDVDLLITNKIVALNDNNKATTIQPQKPLKSFPGLSQNANAFVKSINNATTTDQLSDLRKKLDDPKSQLSKLPQKQKKDINLFITEKIVAISNAQGPKKRS